MFESVPPARYGGTERVVHYLTEALVELGHDVTLFASGDSCTSARLIAPCARALRLGTAKAPSQTRGTSRCSSRCIDRSHDFDVVNFHLDYLPLPAATRRMQLRRTSRPCTAASTSPSSARCHAEFSELPSSSRCLISSAACCPRRAGSATSRTGLRCDAFELGCRWANYLGISRSRVAAETGSRSSRSRSHGPGRTAPRRFAATVGRERAAVSHEVTAVRRDSRNRTFDWLGEVQDGDRGGALLGERTGRWCSRSTGPSRSAW